MKRKVRRFAEGGGYEEDPKPGSNVRDIVSKDKGKSKPRKTASRDISAMEFLSDYERSAPSKRMKDEAETAARSKSSIKPYAGEYEETRDVMANLTPEQKKNALELGITALAGEGIGAAQIPLRVKQMLRARKIAKANEAARAADKAGEAARRGMSRRDIPRYDERYRASEAAHEQRKAYEDAALSGLMYKKGGKIKGYKTGGSVQSKASSRGDGIASRGRTKGKFV
jgi:hypothetical protein